MTIATASRKLGGRKEDAPTERLPVEVQRARRTLRSTALVQRMFVADSYVLMMLALGPGVKHLGSPSGKYEVKFWVFGRGRVSLHQFWSFSSSDGFGTQEESIIVVAFGPTTSVHTETRMGTGET